MVGGPERDRPHPDIDRAVESLLGDTVGGERLALALGRRAAVAPIAGTTTGSKPRPASSSTTVAATSAIRSMPRLPTPIAMTAPRIGTRERECVESLSNCGFDIREFRHLGFVPDAGELREGDLVNDRFGRVGSGKVHTFLPQRTGKSVVQITTLTHSDKNYVGGTHPRQ